MAMERPEGDPVPTESVRQVAAFLAAAVHAEVDNARMSAVRVLGTDDGSHVYAGAVVTGPLRAYVATAWGAAGHASGKKIVSYPDATAAQAALDAALAHQATQGYSPLGTVDGDA